MTSVQLTKFNKAKHLTSIVYIMTKDRRVKGFSPQDVFDAAKILNLDMSHLSKHDDRVIRITAIMRNKPNNTKKDFHPDWTKEALDEVFE